MTKLFGTDGVRGKAEWLVSSGLAAEIGAAIASVSSLVTVAADPRLSSPVIERQVVRGLVGGGARVLRLGVLPTPACAYLTKLLGADYGVMITASHNPPSYNGVKLFGEGGKKLSADKERLIERIVSGGVYRRGLGEAEVVADAAERYIDYVVAEVGADFRGAEVTLDCCHGATAGVAADIFRRLGASVTSLGSSPDGELINVYSGSTNLDYLKGNLKGGIGFAFDGDGDRVLGVVDGRTVDGDNMLYVLARDLKTRARLKNNLVVGTKMTNVRLAELLREENVELIIADVGDKFVMEEMERTGAVLGGEASGHVIAGALGTGDGVLTAARLLKLYMEDETVFDAYLPYPQLTLNLSVDKRILKHPKLRAAQEECATLLNGIGRLLVRPSGTEPVVRVTVECKNEAVGVAVLNRLRAAFAEAITE